MTAIILLIALFFVLDLAALHLGANSSDGVTSPEWERRQKWYLPIRH